MPQSTEGSVANIPIEEQGPWKVSAAGNCADRYFKVHCTVYDLSRAVYLANKLNRAERGPAKRPFKVKRAAGNGGKR